MIRNYETICFESEIDWERVPVGKIDCFQWEEDPPFRPESSFQMCFLKNKGVFVKMNSNEKKLRRTCTKRDENIWEDSCLEFFFSPEKNAGYLNTEMNPNGAFLTQVGKERGNRRFLKEITPLSPEVSAHTDENGWGVELFIPRELFEEAFKISFDASPGVFRGNFFKCGDKTETPHYGSFSPMGSISLGFHNPPLFATITVKEDVLKNG